MALTAEIVAQRVTELELVEPHAVQDVWSDLGRTATGDQLLVALVRQNLLTSWQVERVKKDYRVGFFYGDYKILYLAGAGTFARVYRAMHKDTGEIVAVKVLRSRHADDENVVGHFVREGQVGKKLRHPNIVAIYTFGQEERTYYIVMEFVEGNNLRDFVRVRKRLPPLEATRILMEITGAIKYANQQGYAHRDLKMTNVLISTSGQAKLIDFGLAAKKGEEIPRTVDYAGLEKAGGGEKDDPRSDLYFIGCIYYHMLTGEPPLKETKNRAERGARGRYLNVVPVQHMSVGLPRYVGEIVDRATHINPEIRYQSPAQLLIDLKRITERLSQEKGDAAEEGEDAPLASGPKQSIMIVESDPESQEQFREGLRRSGYRVLLTSDPFRALERFAQDPAVAECVIFSAEAIGHDAVDAFNRLAEDEKTKHIPAILLLAEGQREWRHEMHQDSQHIFMSMPVKLKALRAVLARLLSKPAAEGEEEGVSPIG